MHLIETPIVIVGGIPLEVEVFASQLAGRAEMRVQGLPCISGTLGGQPCILTEMGMGKVNAAMATTLLITHLRPRMVICAGGGGGLNPMLSWGDTVIVEKVIQHDYGALRPDGMTRWPTLNPIAEDENPLYIPTDADLVAQSVAAGQRVMLPTITTRLGERRPRVLVGVLATGDIYATDPGKRLELWQTLRADIIDMEGAAVVQVGRQLGTPVLVIRSISDIDEHVGTDWETYFRISVQNAAQVVMEVIVAAKWAG